MSQSSEPHDPVVSPINLARARHSQGEHTRFTRPASEGTDKAAYPTDNVFNGLSSCLLIGLLSAAFLIGGTMGGMVGAGIMLWSGSASVALLTTPTATPLPPSPTPAPVITNTPTATPEPIPTPSAEEIIESVLPSVVTVINKQQRFYYNTNGEGRVVGSGVVVDDRGYVVTNHHVVENPGRLSVMLSDGREYVAEFVASDSKEDLAVIKLPITDLPTLYWTDSTSVRLGQQVYAIGSPLGDFPNSVSFGIVSGMSRALEMDEHVIDGLIQTDAAINRGSSGGPLLNNHGAVIGINTFFIRESEDRGVAEGIAFAIPVDTVKRVINPWIMAHSGETRPIMASEDATN